MTGAETLLYRVITVSSNMLLREIRKDKGLTQKALALKAKMSITHLCNIEKGKADPSLNTLRRLAKALRVKVSVLVADE